MKKASSTTEISLVKCSVTGKRSQVISRKQEDQEPSAFYRIHFSALSEFLQWARIIFAIRKKKNHRLKTLSPMCQLIENLTLSAVTLRRSYSSLQGEANPKGG